MKLVSAIFPVLLTAVVACGGGGGGAGAMTTATATSGAPAFDPAATNQAKCGACHAPFDPGGHTKAELERVLKVHQNEKRVVLQQGEWQQMIDYLATK